MVASKLLLAIATIGLALPAQAASAPIVFDFEDGLQGWELHGAATRVQTQVLGGEWAIFGDGSVGGPASISIEMDLTDIASISVEMFLVDGDEDGLGALIESDLIGNGVALGSFGFDVIEPGNPSIRAIDVRSITGVGRVEIGWNRPFMFGDVPSVVGFIDNITFHPVPEPSS